MQPSCWSEKGPAERSSTAKAGETSLEGKLQPCRAAGSGDTAAWDLPALRGAAPPPPGLPAQDTERGHVPPQGLETLTLPGKSDLFPRVWLPSSAKIKSPP